MCQPSQETAKPSAHPLSSAQRRRLRKKKQSSSATAPEYSTRAHSRSRVHSREFSLKSASKLALFSKHSQEYYHFSKLSEEPAHRSNLSWEFSQFTKLSPELNSVPALVLELNLESTCFPEHSPVSVSIHEASQETAALCLLVLVIGYVWLAHTSGILP